MHNSHLLELNKDSNSGTYLPKAPRPWLPRTRNWMFNFSTALHIASLGSPTSVIVSATICGWKTTNSAAYTNSGPKKKLGFPHFEHVLQLDSILSNPTRNNHLNPQYSEISGCLEEVKN